jgi:cytochrome c-type biogenesis protein CcmH
MVVDRTAESPTASTSPNANAPAPQTPEKPVRALSDEQLERMVEQANSQTQKDPKDVTSWAMLAHSYDMLGKFAESAKAYEQLVKLAPKDAQVLADYADALAVAHGRSLEGEPSKLIDKALAIDPKNLKALSLAGTAAFERQDYAQAVALWDRARAVSTDPQFTLQIESGISEARALAKGESASAPAPVASAVAAAPGVAFVSGRVSLADDLIKKAPPDATVFVFARPAQGSRMPVALLRKQVRDLPLDFKLDDSMSMVPDAKLSQVPAVIIGARVSMRGDVMPQPGDMQGWSAPVNVGTKGIKLEISEVLK